MINVSINAFFWSRTNYSKILRFERVTFLKEKELNLAYNLIKSVSDKLNNLLNNKAHPLIYQSVIVELFKYSPKHYTGP